MAGEVIVSSTTDSQAAVDTAAKFDGSVAPEEERVEKPSEPPEEPAEAEEPVEKPESEEPEDEEEEEEATASKSRRRLLRQVNRLTGRNYKLQEQLEELQSRLNKSETATKQPAPVAGPPKPVPADFRNYEDYVEALADWKVGERDRIKLQAEQQAYVQRVYDEYNQQVEEARDAHADFDKVVGQAVDVPMIAIQSMYELDNGAEVAYYLGKHPEVRERLLEWNEPGTKGGIRKIVVELDRISEQLSGKSSGNNASPRPKTSEPPPPIRPVGSTARSTVDPGQMPMREYKKWYAEHFPNSR